MSNNSKQPVKLQLRMYPEKNEHHRRALAWLTEHKADGASYADLVSQCICAQIDRQQTDDTEERLRQVIREELRNGLRSVTINAVPAESSQVEPQRTSEKGLSKAKGFMSGMGFG